MQCMDDWVIRSLFLRQILPQVVVRIPVCVDIADFRAIFCVVAKGRIPLLHKLGVLITQACGMFGTIVHIDVKERSHT